MYSNELGPEKMWCLMTDEKYLQNVLIYISYDRVLFLFLVPTNLMWYTVETQLSQLSGNFLCNSQMKFNICKRIELGWLKHNLIFHTVWILFPLCFLKQTRNAYESMTRIGLLEASAEGSKKRYLWSLSLFTPWITKITTCLHWAEIYD